MAFPRLLFTVSFPIIIGDVLQRAAAAERNRLVTDGEQFVKRIVHGEKMPEIPRYLQFTAPYKLCEGDCDGDDNSNFAFAFPVYIGRKGKEEYKKMFSRDIINQIRPNGLFKRPSMKKIFTLCPTSAPSTNIETKTFVKDCPTLSTEYVFDTQVIDAASENIDNKVSNKECFTTKAVIVTPTTETETETSIKQTKILTSKTESIFYLESLARESETQTKDITIPPIDAATESQKEKELRKNPTTETKTPIIEIETVAPATETKTQETETKTIFFITETVILAIQQEIPTTKDETKTSIANTKTSTQETKTANTEAETQTFEIITETSFVESETKNIAGDSFLSSPANQTINIESDIAGATNIFGRRCPLKICNNKKPIIVRLDSSESKEKDTLSKAHWDSDYTDVLDSLYSA